LKKLTLQIFNIALLGFLAACIEQIESPPHDVGPIINLKYDAGRTSAPPPRDAGPSRQPQAYDSGPAVHIQEITPPTGPVLGGPRVRLRGYGFMPDTTVTVSGQAAEDVFSVNQRVITFRLPPGTPGPAEIRVQNSLGVSTSSDFEYVDENAPQVHPNRGSIAGGTYVTLVSVGIGSETASVMFGGMPGIVEDAPDENTLNVYTPQGLTGYVDVSIDSNGSTTDIRGGFEYYDPAFITGGVHGNNVSGSFNVKVLTIIQGERIPLADSLVWLGVEQEPRYAKKTNQLGLATLSGPSVYGAQTVTIAARYCDTETYVEVPSEDLTVYLNCSFPSPPSSGAPPSQPPVVFPRIRGVVTGFSKALFDPNTLGPYERAFGFIDLTQKNIFSRKTPKATAWEQPVPQGGRPCTWFSSGNCIVIFGNDTIFEDNAPFDFITIPGRFALVAFTGVINVRTQEITSVRQMGIRRGINAVFGETVSDIVINLEYDLENSTVITLPEAPFYAGTREGPTHSKVSTFLDFGGEGVYHLSTKTAARTHVVVESIPSVPGQMLTFYAGTYTRAWDPDYDNVVSCRMHTDCQRGQTCREGSRGLSCHGSYSYNEPYSAIIRSGPDDISGGVMLGQMMQFPSMNQPTRGSFLRNRMMQWRTQPISPQPSLYMFTLAEASTGNQWHVFVPGHLTKFKLPYFPQNDLESEIDHPGSGAFLYRMTTALLPGFDFGQWDLEEISSHHRRAWTQEVEVFTLDN